MLPRWWSWPTTRHAEPPTSISSNTEDPACDGEALQAWLRSLTIDDDGQLLISADSLRLLPARLPYELLAHALQAAVDSCASAQQQQLSGLRLVAVDLQEPAARPLRTCIAAYPCLTRLSLAELNVDVTAAAALGAIAGGVSGGSLQHLALEGTFMCDLAWQAFADGLAAGCQLTSLRLADCLTVSSMVHLARGLQGCQHLRALDVSLNSLQWGSSSSSSSDKACDAAWVELLQALAGCTQLRSLRVCHCSLGSAAAAVLSKLLRRQQPEGSNGLEQLALAHCSSIGNAALEQLVVSATACRSLALLDLGRSGVTDACLTALGSSTSKGPASWWRGGPAAQLQELRLAGCSQVSTPAICQLLSQLGGAAGPLAQLVALDLAGCAVGDQGVAALAAAAQSSHGCSLRRLDLTSCEISDGGVVFLAAALAGGAGCAALQLEELRLGDNQLTSAGMAVLAAAVSKPSCRLTLLDVSLNWAPPSGMRPLREAAAAIAAAAALTGKLAGAAAQRQLTVLCECLPELWRVEASKAAAVQGLQAAAAGGEAEQHEHASSACSSSRGSCCSQAGSCAASTAAGAASPACSPGRQQLAAGAAAAAAAAAGLQHAPCSKAAISGSSGDGKVWLFNSLFRSDTADSGASAAIKAALLAPEEPACQAAGADDYECDSDICQHYAASDGGSAQLPGSSVCSSSCTGSPVSRASSLSTVDPQLLASANGSEASLCWMRQETAAAAVGSGSQQSGSGWAAALVRREGSGSSLPDVAASSSGRGGVGVTAEDQQPAGGAAASAGSPRQLVRVPHPPSWPCASPPASGLKTLRSMRRRVAPLQQQQLAAGGVLPPAGGGQAGNSSTGTAQQGGAKAAGGTRQRVAGLQQCSDSAAPRDRRQAR